MLAMAFAVVLEGAAFLVAGFFLRGGTAALSVSVSTFMVALAEASVDLEGRLDFEALIVLGSDEGALAAGVFLGAGFFLVVGAFVKVGSTKETSVFAVEALGVRLGFGEEEGAVGTQRDPCQYE